MINITKQSGVISIQDGTNPPQSFFGSVGSFRPNGANNGWNIAIGNANYSISLTDLRINGQAPASMDNGKVLLTAIFGT